MKEFSFLRSLWLCSGYFNLYLLLLLSKEQPIRFLGTIQMHSMIWGSGEVFFNHFSLLWGQLDCLGGGWCSLVQQMLGFVYLSLLHSVLVYHLKGFLHLAVTMICWSQGYRNHRNRKTSFFVKTRQSRRHSNIGKTSQQTSHINTVIYTFTNCPIVSGGNRWPFSQCKVMWAQPCIYPLSARQTWGWHFTRSSVCHLWFSLMHQTAINTSSHNAWSLLRPNCFS